MSDQPIPGGSPDLPPDLPPEYAETYRRAYQAAYRDLQAGRGEAPADAPTVAAASGKHPGQHAAPHPEQPAEPARFAVSGPLFADEGRAGPGSVEPTQTLTGLALLEQAQAHQEEAPGRHDERPAWLVPGLLALAVVLLLGAAFGIGKAVSHGVGGADQAAGGSSAPDAARSVTEGGGGQGGTHEARGKPYRGAVQAVSVRGASASCQSPPAVDAAGHPVRYQPAHVFDGDLTTAWRCNGDGVGERLTLRLPAGSRIGEVGLVPGYAKTDARSGANRYAENDRITKVRWVFGDGTTVTQRFDGSAKRRDLQTERIPVVRADRVVVEILASTPGPRHTVAVSEVELAGPAG